MKNQKLKQCINFQKRRRKLIVDPVFSWKPINCVSHYTHAISYNEKQFHTWNYLGRRSSCVHIWWARGFCKTSYTHLKCWEVASLSFSGFLIDKKFLTNIRTFHILNCSLIFLCESWSATIDLKSRFSIFWL